ncbi:probable gluconokinase isoform X6 [Vicugna pacos]|uniref:gluconokinase n=1 Tax=Vicugna pacos TaxID=30538 RepID=A0ABM5D336_VICPA
MAAPGAVLVMGVSGSGKSTVGALLASELGWKFYDADDYHPEENLQKMGKGIPLSDQDRIPWLCTLHDILQREVASGQHVVLACSALKKVYRDILIQGKDGAPLKRDESGKEEKTAEQRAGGSQFGEAVGRLEVMVCCSHTAYQAPASKAATRPAKDPRPHHL